MERSRVKDIKKKFEVTQTTESSIKNDVNKTESNQNNSVNSELSKQDDLSHQNLRLSNSNCGNFVGRGNIKRSHAFRADKPITRKDFNNVGSDLLFSADITNSLVSHDTARSNTQLLSNKQSGYDSRQKRYSCKKKDNNFNNNSNTNSSTDLESNSNKDYFNSNIVTCVGSSVATPSTSKDFHQRSCNIISDERDENPSVRDTYSTVLKSNKNNTKESPKNVILNNSNSKCISGSSIISNENCDKSANKTIKSNKMNETDVKSIIKSVEQRNLQKKNSDEKLKSHKLLRATQSNSSSSNIQVSECLSNTLKAALSAPLPTGPPPKKPPRTFAHNITSTVNESPPKTDNELKVQKPNSSIGTNLQPNDFPKPIRSKTESQIMLKKLENYLLNHQQQNTSSNLNMKCSNSKISISSSSNNKNLLKMDKQHSMVDTEGVIQSNLSDIRNPRVNSNMNSENVSISRQSTNTSNNNNNLCFNSLNCTKRPIYESQIYKKSNFFVTFPRQTNSITCDNETDSTINEFRRTSYGTIQRAVSDEHIYAEPETINEYSDFIAGRNNLKMSSSKLKSATISDRCRRSSGDNHTPNSSKSILTAVNNNSKITTSNVKLMRANFEQDPTLDGGSLSWPSSPPPLPPSSTSNSMITQYGLHYMCTPINDSSHHNVNTRHGDSLNSSLLSSATTVAAVSSPSASDDFTLRIRDNKLINEAINASVKLSLIKTPATSLPYPSSQSDLQSGNDDHLLSVNNGSDCRRPPRRNRHNFSAISCAPNDTSNIHPSANIDKQKINQLLSEAYGKIRPSTGFADRNNRISSPGMSTLSQVGSTGIIVSDFNRSGSATDSDSSSPEPEDIHNQRTSNMSIEEASIASTGSSVGNGNTGSIGKNSKDREQITAERKGYVRRVSRRLTSVRKYTQFGDDRFPHLFECLLLVGLDLNSARCKVPYIKTKFPEHMSSPTGIERLCFPDADDWPPSPNSGQSYTQVLTDSNGVRKYSYCRRVQPEDAIICLPLVYCIITSFKSNMFYNKILIDLESRHGLQSDVELKKFIQQLYDCPFPAPGQNLSIHQQINSSTDRGGPTLDVYKRSLDSRQEDNELAQLLTTVKLSVFLQMFTTLLHERKVILVSDSISKLSVCIEGLQSALYPFHWQHTIVPILPSCLMDVCQAPTPYLIGIIKPKLSDIPFNNSDLDLVVDIDDGLILNSIGDEGWILPSRLSRGLRSALLLSIQAASQSHSQSQSSDLNTANILASEAIMRLFVELIGHYRDHIAVVSNDTKKREFQRDSFVRSGSSRSVQLFLEWFTETAMFNAFIESRLERSSESRGLFEQRCSEYIEEHGINGGGSGGVNTHAAGHSIMKNYKAINKTVKNLGDRFKDWASSTSSS